MSHAESDQPGATDLGAVVEGAIDPSAADLRKLIARAVAADGAPPFSDQTLVDLAVGTRRVVSLDPAAIAVVAQGETGGESGRGLIAEFELLVDPNSRRLGHATRLLEHLLSIAPNARLAWAHGDLPGSRQLAARFGFEPVRELLQLRRDAENGGSTLKGAARKGAAVEDAAGEGAASDDVTPERASRATTTGAAATTATEATAAAAANSRPGLSFSTFDAERDADDWVELNARAFASHPEQGSVTRDDLDALTRTEWFDADDFLLLRDDTGTGSATGSPLIGYCWLKVEAAQQPDTAVAEFYVVGVDPERQGEGLGRVLVEAGLAHVAGRGIRTASLYVDGDNTSALALYRSLGFTQFAIDVQYARPTS